MKSLSIPLLFTALGVVTAFQVFNPSCSARSATAPAGRTWEAGPLFSTLDGTDSPSLDKSAITSVPKDRLLDIANSLNEKFGVFVIDKNGQEELRRAVEELEAVAESPAFDDDTQETMLGQWTLVCTTTSSTALPSTIGNGIDTSKLPFFNEGPLKEIRDSLNKCLTVQQSIMCKNSYEIDRVDHILEYKPPKTLQDLLDKLPSLDINPLDITKGKIVLVHDAAVTNKGPAFSIQLKLASIVVNVAGTSKYLDPDGQDLLGVNSPLKEFQAGTFETTYLDEDFRISRTTQTSTMGATSQLRIYVKSAEQEAPPENALDEEYFDEFDKFGSEKDEDDSTDDEFDNFGIEEDDNTADEFDNFGSEEDNTTDSDDDDKNA